jgi:hypothetical protein
VSELLQRYLEVIYDPRWCPTIAYYDAMCRGEIAEGEPMVIDCGNSGTAMRLLAGWLAGQGGLRREVEKAFTRDELIQIKAELERGE